MAQFAYPDSDIENPGGWTVTPLWEKIDEEPFDDGDYLTSSKTATGDSFTIGLSDVIDPEVHTAHVVRIRAKTGVSGTFKYELIQGAVVIKDSGNVVLSTAFVEYSMSLSEAEAANISDYADLRVRVTAVVTQKNQRQNVSWIRFEVPDVGGATPKLVGDSGSGIDSIGVKVKLSVDDSGLGGEQLGLKAALSLSDLGLGVDVPKVGKSLLISDVAFGVEKTAILSKLTVQDVGTGIEVLFILSRLTLQELGMGIDSVSLVIRLVVLDSGIGADIVNVQMQQAVQKLVQDGGVGQESVMIKVLLSILDDAFGSDSLTVRQFRAVLDAGEAEEVVWDDAYIPVQDSGLGSEALSILSKVGVQDVGLAIELLGILSKIYIQDLGIGIDEALAEPISKKIVLDSGVGDESVSKEIIELIAYIICLLESRLEIKAKLEKGELDIRAKLGEDLDIKGVLKE